MSSASELISNLQAAIQSQEAAEQAFEDWEFEYKRNEAALALALERRPILLAEKERREHDLLEGRKDAAKANEAWWQFCRVAVRPEQAAPLPASPAQSPAPKSTPGAPKKKTVLTLEERQAMTEAEQNAFLGGRMSKEQVAALSKEEKRRRQALKSAARDERKEHRTAEEQAKIDARVAAMSAGRAKKASPARALEEELNAAVEE